MDNQNQECCPVFDVEKWDKKTFNWENKLFLKETMPALFHMPFVPLIGKKVGKMHTSATSAGAAIPDPSDALILFRDPSPFRSDIYYSVTREVEGANNTTISGTFAAMVFDGPYNGIPKFIKEMDSYLAAKGQKAKDYYLHYAYCPKCAKKYGHNYMVLFALV